MEKNDQREGEDYKTFHGSIGCCTSYTHPNSYNFYKKYNIRWKTVDKGSGESIYLDRGNQEVARSIQSVTGPEIKDWSLTFSRNTESSEINRETIEIKERINHWTDLGPSKGNHQGRYYEFH